MPRAARPLASSSLRERAGTNLQGRNSARCSLYKLVFWQLGKVLNRLPSQLPPMEARTNEGLEADALLEDLSFFQEDLDGGASSSKTPKLSQQAPGSLLIGGYRKGHKFTSSFATRRVKKGDIGLVVEQVSLYDAPFLRVDFGTNKGVVDFNSMYCVPVADEGGGMRRRLRTRRWCLRTRPWRLRTRRWRLCRKKGESDRTAHTRGSPRPNGSAAAGPGQQRERQQKVRHARAASASTSASGANARSAGARASASTSASGANARSAGARACARISAKGADARSAARRPTRRCRRVWRSLREQRMLLEKTCDLSHDSCDAHEKSNTVVQRNAR